MENHVFGPVPSRRLGRSIGINNIPPKVCSYSCSYCQVGKAIKMQIKRQPFYPPEMLVKEVMQLLQKIQLTDEYPDYLTIVPDGEPTLDSQLGILIAQLKQFNIKIAIITNGSLLYLNDVREGLSQADYVSVKIDSVVESVWRKINKPVKQLQLNTILEGINTFASEYKGTLVSETMLLKDINDNHESLEQTSEFIQTLNPAIAYLGIPTRPTALMDAFPADEETVNIAFHLFQTKLNRVELLTGYEGSSFASTGNFEEDILSITAVHPMREDAVVALLNKTMSSVEQLNKLLDKQMLKKVYYQNNTYYVRRFSSTLYH
jgi:wyosine [tRNA(Phe)-imidazoG37] synthetase (radical SAM superfamily)